MTQTLAQRRAIRAYQSTGPSISAPPAHIHARQAITHHELDAYTYEARRRDRLLADLARDQLRLRALLEPSPLHRTVRQMVKRTQRWWAWIREPFQQEFGAIWPAWFALFIAYGCAGVWATTKLLQLL